MNDDELSAFNSIPGAIISGIGVIGIPFPSKIGFWFEADKSDSDWVYVDNRIVFTKYNDNI